MKQFSKIFAIIFITFPFFIACNSEKGTIHGNHQIAVQKFTVEDFSSILLNNLEAEVIYQQYSDTAPYLQINTDENILPYLNVRVADNQLIIEAQPDSIVSPSKLKIYTNSKSLAKVDLTGSGKVHLLGEVNSREMEIKIQGSGEIVTDSLICHTLNMDIVGSGIAMLKGAATESRLSIQGDGNIDASGYLVENLQTDIIGSGKVKDAGYF